MLSHDLGHRERGRRTKESDDLTLAISTNLGAISIFCFFHFPGHETRATWLRADWSRVDQLLARPGLKKSPRTAEKKRETPPSNHMTRHKEQQKSKGNEPQTTLSLIFFRNFSLSFTPFFFHHIHSPFCHGPSTVRERITLAVTVDFAGSRLSHSSARESSQHCEHSEQGEPSDSELFQHASLISWQEVHGHVAAQSDRPVDRLAEYLDREIHLLRLATRTGGSHLELSIERAGQHSSWRRTSLVDGLMAFSMCARGRGTSIADRVGCHLWNHKHRTQESTETESVSRCKGVSGEVLRIRQLWVPPGGSWARTGACPSERSFQDDNAKPCGHCVAIGGILFGVRAATRSARSLANPAQMACLVLASPCPVPSRTDAAVCYDRSRS